jgi:very-short-patch-repair endonuclease
MATPDHGKGSPRRVPDAAGNESLAQRGKRSSGRPTDAAGNKIHAEDGLNQRIARLAGAQRGTITRAQLLELGLDRGAIERRANDGTLHRVHRGVYLVGHEALAPMAREIAALLAFGGERAVISHSSAAGVWGFAAPLPAGADVHVTLIGSKRRSRAGVCLHRIASIDRRDLRRVDGVPLTAPARTLLDLAAIKHHGLEHAFIEAHAKGLVRANDVEAALHRAGPRHGARALRALISDNASGFTRSRAERLLPRFNLPFGKYVVDACWPEQRLVVEVDGYGPHGHRAAFERDRRKDMALTAAGYTVIRVTWRQLNEEPLAVVAVIATALGRGRQPG